MMTLPVFQLPEIVPHADVHAWQKALYEEELTRCKNYPPEVSAFIDSISAKLPDFQQYQRETMKMTGIEMLLCNIKVHDGQEVRPWGTYNLPVPKMLAVAHRTSMLRLFRKKGKQGLIDYVKAKVKATDLEKVLTVLNVHVFHEERPEFKKMMNEISAANKIESPIAA